jgi:c-di-GMP-binding flagellar brake protein YcgR
LEKEEIVAFFINEPPTLERRQFRRLKISSPISYRFFNTEKYQQSITCDISEGGVSFTSDGEIPIGTYLYFHVQLTKRPQPFYGIAKIAWASKEPYGGKYRIGIEFVETGSISKADIYSAIQENRSPAYNS